jgi:hypothetical protein
MPEAVRMIIKVSICSQSCEKIRRMALDKLITPQIAVIICQADRYSLAESPS